MMDRDRRCSKCGGKIRPGPQRVSGGKLPVLCRACVRRIRENGT